jgi:antitoxin YefM
LQEKTKEHTFPIMKSVKSVKSRDARWNILDRLLDEATVAHEEVLITGPRSNAVLVSEEDWNAIQETLRLLSVSGMGESIREGLDTSVVECEKELGW